MSAVPSPSLSLEASQILPNLWQGSRPRPGRYPLDTIVLAAKEIQPSSLEFPGIEVIHAPLDDNPAAGILPHERPIICQAALDVARRVRAGKRVLVTCAAGLNRSGLIVATALRMLNPHVPADDIIRHIRLKRDLAALRNPHFEEHVRADACRLR